MSENNHSSQCQNKTNKGEKFATEEIMDKNEIFEQILHDMGGFGRFQVSKVFMLS